MRRTSHRLLLVLGLLTGLLAVLGAAAQAPPRPLIVFGVDADNEPLSWIDGRGRLRGFNADLARAVGEKAGFEVELRAGNPRELQQAQQDGEIDVRFLLYSPEREAYFDFAEASIVLSYQAIVRPDSPRISSWQDLRGRTVAVLAGSLIRERLQAQGIPLNLLTVDSPTEALARVASGRADVALVANFGAATAMARFGRESLVISGPPLLPMPYGMAVRKGRPELLARLNEGLADVRASGQYGEIYDRWFHLASQGLTRAALLRYALWIGIPLLLLGAAVLAWIWTLRREVARRTRDLRQELAERRRAEQRLQYQATHDSLTDLANRTLLQDRLGHAIARAVRENDQLAVLFVDLDRFKTINDSLGHGEGDRLLQAVASRLRHSTRADDTVARLGGDEFIVLLESLESEAGAFEAASKLLDALGPPYWIGERELFIGASIGVALFPRDGGSAELLLRNADAALYRAKERGRGRVEFYAPELNERATHRLELEKELRYALARGELELYYQPQMDLASGRLMAAEALIRWNHPQRGLVSPGEFIPLAEESGLILSIGEWVTRSACRQLVHWGQNGLGHVQLAINLSARQFLQADVVAKVAAALAESGIASSRLKLEITENAVMADLDMAVLNMHALRKLGVGLVIDDFGTGHSSLNYLKLFPVDQLKIDASFVRDITTDRGDATISRSVITLAHGLRLKAIAEGVETREQLDVLRHYRCDWVQGYYHSRPLPEAQFIERFARAG